MLIDELYTHIKHFKAPGWLEGRYVDRALTHGKITNSRLNQQSSDIKGAALSCLSFPARKEMLCDW